MSHAKPPSDLLDQAEPLDENLLRRALAPKRPRADAFRQGVQKRIEEKRDRLEAERQRQELRLVQAPEHLRWAAGIVPVGLVPGALSGAGLIGKKLSVKAFPALFALPLVSVGMPDRRTPPGRPLHLCHDPCSSGDRVMSAALDLDLLIDRWRGPLVDLLACPGSVLGPGRGARAGCLRRGVDPYRTLPRRLQGRACLRSLARGHRTQPASHRSAQGVGDRADRGRPVRE